MAGGTDILSLTDGKLASAPMWVAPGTLGWQSITPVSVELHVAEAAVRIRRLSLHVACNHPSGIHLPRRVDLYARQQDGYVHRGSMTPGDLCTGTAVWLDLDAPLGAGDYVLILHARQDYLFLDEIAAVGPDGPATVAAVRPDQESGRTLERDELQADSIARLRRQLMAPMPAVAPAAGVTMWVAEPWSAVEPERRSATDLLVNGARREVASCVAGLATAKEGYGAWRLRLTPAPLTRFISLFEVRPVLAANGQRVFDPLLPVTDGLLHVDDGAAHYLWLRVDLSRIPAAETDGALELESMSNPTLHASLPIHVTRHEIPEVRPLNAVVWGYADDGPIWRDPDRTLEELSAAGVNVHVIAARQIPGTQLDGHRYATQESTFWPLVQRLSQHGLVLLFTDWNEALVPAESLQPGTPRYLELQRFLAWLQDGMRRRGIAVSQWALYPRDEPHSDLSQAVKLLSTIKTLAPAVRLYVNPTTHAIGDAQGLTQLHRLADYWQPNLETARSPVNATIVGDSRQWIYDNPGPPAKAASPLEHYRKLAWWAAKLGATGVGFWSFSDTGGSSAWDDFDGHYPDWAAVYEGPAGAGPVSSRRWEAFKQGLEDYRLLSAAGIDLHDVNVGALSALDMERIRVQALDGVHGSAAH